MVKTILPLRVERGSYVFTNRQGKPIDQAEFGRAFQGVLRVLEIRPRSFYNTRHTFISLALTAGENIKAISEQCGTSIQMIEQHYGRYMRNDFGRAMLKETLTPASDELAEQAEEHLADAAYSDGAESEDHSEETDMIKPVDETDRDFPVTFSGDVSNALNPLVVPTGQGPHEHPVA